MNRRPAPTSDPGHKRVTRKTVMRWLTGAGLLGAGGLVGYSFLERDPYPVVPIGSTIELPEAASLEPGASQTFDFNGRPSILLRRPDGAFEAYDAVCTHRACVVVRQPDGFLCPCHQGRYDASGEPVEGPPPRALTRYRSEVVGTAVRVKRQV